MAIDGDTSTEKATVGLGSHEDWILRVVFRLINGSYSEDAVFEQLCVTHGIISIQCITPLVRCVRQKLFTPLALWLPLHVSTTDDAAITIKLVGLVPSV